MPRNLIGLLAICMAVAMHMASAQTPMEKPLGPVSPKGLSAQQAEQVLLLVLKHEGYNLESPSSQLNDFGEMGKEKFSHPGYWDFIFGYFTDTMGASWEYAVSKLTGDVWEFHRCKRYAFPALQDLQKSIMQQTGKTMADEQAQRSGLHCMDDASAPVLRLGPISPKGLSPHQAGELLIFVLKYKEGKMPIYWADQALKYYKGGWVHFKRSGIFYYIEWLRSQSSDHWNFGLSTANSESVVIHGAGLYSVSKLTGDVIDTDACERYDFPALQRIQKSIMKQTKKTMVSEKAQREKLLPCPDELLY